jgi:hypothetical protein
MGRCGADFVWHSNGGIELNGASPIVIEWFESADRIADSLWQACFPPPLEGKWWYLALERSGLHDQFSFYYGLIKKGEKPIGIAPAFVMNVPIDLVAPPVVAKILQGAGAIVPSLRYQRTLFIGSVCADEGTIGLLPEARLPQIIEPLHDKFEKKARELKASIIVWKDFPQTDDPALNNLCQTHGAAKIVSYPGTVISLPKGGFKEYLASLKGTHRYNLSKKLKRSKKLGDLQTSVIQKPDDKTFDEIMSLFWQTYEHGKTKFEKLNKRFFELIAEENVSWFVLLRNPETQELVAFMLCFKFDDKVINKFIGLDYRMDSQWFLYFRLWEAAVDWAMQNGATEFQSGQTGYRAKLDVGHSLIPLNNYFRNFNPLVHFVCEKIADTVDWSSIDDELATYVKAHPEADMSQPGKISQTL